MKNLDDKFDAISTALSKGTTERTMNEYIKEGEALSCLVEIRSQLKTIHSTINTEWKTDLNNLFAPIIADAAIETYDMYDRGWSQGRVDLIGEITTLISSKVNTVEQCGGDDSK